MDDKIKLARQIVSSFPPEQKNAFIKKFGSLKDDTQRQKVIDNVITKFGSTIKNQEADPETAMDRRETRIALREDFLSKFSPEKVLSLNPLESGGNNLKLIAGLAQRGTASVVNPMLNLQSGNFNAIEAAKSSMNGIRGERLGEVGDLYVGAGANEPTAATLGFATEAMLTAPETISDLARGVTKVPSMLKSAQKAISKINPRFTELEKSTIKNIEKQRPIIQKSIEAIGEKTKQLQSQLSSLKESYSKKVSDLSYKGSKQLEHGIEKSFESAKSNYANTVMNLKDEKVPFSEAKSLIDDVIKSKELGSRTILSQDEEALISLSKKYQELAKKRHYIKDSEFDPLLGVDDLKEFKTIVRNGVKGRSDIEAEFYTRYGDMLERNGMGELSKANEVYKKAYSAMEEAKQLKRARLNQIATGKIINGTEEFKDLVQAESKYGLRSTKDAAEAFEKFSQQQGTIGRSIEGGRVQKTILRDMIKQAEEQKMAIEAARKQRLENFKLAGTGAGLIGLGGASGLLGAILRRNQGR